MNRLPLLFQPDSVLPRVLFAAAAAVIAVFLMVFYVQLLQDAVARGAQWRYSQQTAAPTLQAESTSITAQLAR